MFKMIALIVSITASAAHAIDFASCDVVANTAAGIATLRLNGVSEQDVINYVASEENANFQLKKDLISLVHAIYSERILPAAAYSQTLMICMRQD